MNPPEPLANPELETPPPEPASPVAATAFPVTPLEEHIPAAEVVAPRVIGYCRDCGQALYEGAAVHEALGAVYCDVHRPGHVAQAPGTWTAPAGVSSPPSMAPHTISPYSGPQSPHSPQNAGQPWPSASSPPHAGGSPGLAFLLGLIPGVGAVYNGQYAKGLIHVVIFGILISVASNGASGFEPLFGLLIGCFYFYMPFEAYHTAKLRNAGLPVDEFSGVMPRRGPSSAPVGPIVLIVIGVLFLLSNLEVIEFRKLMRFWPAVLIVLGIYMLYERVAVARTNAAENKRDGQ
jgi:hypothetical protein